MDGRYSAPADTAALILAGGRGERLRPLTSHRPKADVPFAGVCRLIDFTVSNCVLTGVSRIGILAQGRCDSLERHLRSSWTTAAEWRDRLVVLRPRHRYRGTADAVYQNLDLLQRANPANTLVLSCDHVYSMDYGPMLRFHGQRRADLTIASMPVRLAEARGLGVLGIDASSRVVDFREKPAVPRECPWRPGWALASMGVYVFDTAALAAALTADASRPGMRGDFGHDIIPSLVARGSRVYAFDAEKHSGLERFYWRDVGGIDTYWQASMDLLTSHARDPQEWPILARRTAPMPKSVVDRMWTEARRTGSLVWPGATAAGSRLRRSIVAPGAVVAGKAEVVESVVLEGAVVGRGACLHRAIVDTHARVPAYSVADAEAGAIPGACQVSPGGVTVFSTDVDAPAA